MKKTVLVGVTSGIAAFKALELIKLLKYEDLNVFVIMTKHATQMVSPQEFEKASENPVAIDLFSTDFDYRKVLKDRTVDHIELADRADLMIIVPATANTIAKIAHGFADDFLTTTTLAVTKPIMVCPSMNVHMWENPAVQENLKTLQKRGYLLIDPDSGMLACGYSGKGRLANVIRIKDEILHTLSVSESLTGKKIIVTAGGTSEKIDDVRSITNRSSGKMGAAIADELTRRGANVLLLRSKTAVQPNTNVPEELFTSADELLQLIKNSIKNYDFMYHVAAVADYIPEGVIGKIASQNAVTLQLKPRLKILDHIKKLNPTMQLIAFKAEYNLSENELIDTAFNRLQESGADVIIANDISKPDQGFESDENEVFIIQKDKTVKKLTKAFKQDIAKRIIDSIHPRLQ